MKSNLNFKLLYLLSFPFFLLSCSGGGGESAIAKLITMSSNTFALVLPNKLSSEAGQTCNTGDVSGPRVRLKASILWNSAGNLVPLVMRLLITNDSRLSGDFAGSLASSADNKESLAIMFGVTDDDFLAPSPTAYETSTCFFDFGSLPKPKTELKGNASVEVAATLSLTGVVRDADGNDFPFIKEIPATITYVAGSVPAN